MPELNRHEAAKRVFASWGVEMKDLLRDPQEVAAEMEAQQMQQQALELAGTPAAAQAVKAATQTE